MTDNEIIKALECCSMGSYPACRDCPYHDDYVNRGCINKRNADIKDLINRQKAENKRLKQAIDNFKKSKERHRAEIERLQGVNKHIYTIGYNLGIREGVKEFAQKVKKAFPSIAHWIDNLLKEMTDT